MSAPLPYRQDELGSPELCLARRHRSPIEDCMGLIMSRKCGIHAIQHCVLAVLRPGLLQYALRTLPRMRVEVHLRNGYCCVARACVKHLGKDRPAVKH